MGDEIQRHVPHVEVVEPVEVLDYKQSIELAGLVLSSNLHN